MIEIDVLDSADVWRERVTAERVVWEGRAALDDWSDVGVLEERLDSHELPLSSDFTPSEAGEMRVICRSSSLRLRGVFFGRLVTCGIKRYLKYGVLRKI